MNSKFVVILGPTGVGKSDTAVWVALQIDGEIISADSIQVYRGMDIGTGKPSLRIMEKVPHHLMNLVDPDEEFNAAKFRESALQAVGQIRFRRKKVVICGGTGLYIKALTHNVFDYGDARDFRRETLIGILDAAREICERNGAELVPATTADIAVSYRGAVPLPTGGETLALDTRGRKGWQRR